MVFDILRLFNFELSSEDRSFDCKVELDVVFIGIINKFLFVLFVLVGDNKLEGSKIREDHLP